MNNLIFRQLQDPESHTYTYILGDVDAKEAVLIDSVSEQTERDLQLLQELGLRLKLILETHVHADHITGAWKLRQQTGASIAMSKQSCIDMADQLLDDGETIYIGAVPVKTIATPGHTKSCMSFLFDHKVLTGDTLLIRATGRCDFQEGSAEQLYDSITNKLFTLPDSTLVYPAHDYRGFTCSSIGEEKRFNQRIGGGKSKEEFVAIMNSLNLAYPKKMDIAVPANLRCGSTDTL